MHTFWISSEENNVIRHIVGIDAETSAEATKRFYAKYPNRAIRSVRTDRRDAE